MSRKTYTAGYRPPQSSPNIHPSTSRFHDLNQVVASSSSNPTDTSSSGLWSRELFVPVSDIAPSQSRHIGTRKRLIGGYVHRLTTMRSIPGIITILSMNHCFRLNSSGADISCTVRLFIQ